MHSNSACLGCSSAMSGDGLRDTLRRMACRVCCPPPPPRPKPQQQTQTQPQTRQQQPQQYPSSHALPAFLCASPPFPLLTGQAGPGARGGAGAGGGGGGGGGRGAFLPLSPAASSRHSDCGLRRTSASALRPSLAPSPPPPPADLSSARSTGQGARACSHGARRGARRAADDLCGAARRLCRRLQGAALQVPRGLR